MLYLEIHPDQTVSQSFSLSPHLQEIVAYATIVSALAVFVYIIQLIVTKSQFKKQFNSNIEQFKTLNQGFLSFELKVASTTPQPMQNANIDPRQIIFSGIAMEGDLTNVGNMPVKCTIVNFTLNGINPPINIKEGPHAVVMIVYPKQKVNVIFTEATFPNNQLYNYPQIAQMGITGNVLISYNDLNDNKKKTINRDYLININNLILGSVYTAVNDTV